MAVYRFLTLCLAAAFLTGALTSALSYQCNCRHSCEKSSFGRIDCDKSCPKLDCEPENVRRDWSICGCCPTCEQPKLVEGEECSVLLYRSRRCGKGLVCKKQWGEKAGKCIPAKKPLSLSPLVYYY